MVVRPDAVRARLLRLEEVIANLLALRDRSPNETSDFRDTWALERGLQLGAEILFDVGNHILSAHFGSAADDYEDILRQLERRGVLDADLATRLRGLGGFRNILVHGYLDLDPARVREKLDRAPEEFSAFAVALRKWLEEQGIGA